MKVLFFVFLFALFNNSYLQTVFSSLGVCNEVPEDLREFVRSVFLKGFIELKKDISHDLKTQSKKWSADFKRTRVLVDALDEQRVRTVHSVRELEDGLTNLSSRTDSLVHSSKTVLLENMTNLSNAIHVNDLHMKALGEEIASLHGAYWDQAENITDLSTEITRLSGQYNWTVSNISELHFKIREMGEISAELNLQISTKVNQTEVYLKRFFVERLLNESKERSDYFSTLQENLTHLSESAVIQAEWTEKSINCLKENLQNETRERTDHLSILQENITHLSESAVTQAQLSEKSILRLKGSLRNETNELSSHISILRENFTQLSDSASKQVKWTEKSIKGLKESLKNETNELSGHINVLQENITQLSESVGKQAKLTEKSILQLKEENKELESMLKGLQLELDELKLNVSASIGVVLKTCPPEWTQFGPSCYLASKIQLSWADAKMRCISHGSKLVEIENKDENDFLKDTLLKDKDRYWTGGVDQVTEGQWVWYSSGTPIRFSDWNPGEPNNSGEEDCLEIIMQRKAWNDLPCQRAKKFICEKNL